jgi:hypothetical protein
MSYVGNTSTDGLSRGQDRRGSFRVAVCGKAAVRAPDGSFRQVKACVSDAAPRTRHCPVGGRHQQHRSARPRATFDQFTFGCAHRGLGTHAGHRGLRQEPGFEALSGDPVMVVDHALGPFPAGVFVLVRALRVQPRRFPRGWPVTVRRLSASGLSGCSTAPSMAGWRHLGHHQGAPFPGHAAQSGGFSDIFR